MATPATLMLIFACIIAAASAQNCGCSPDLCCSQYGYCGTGDPYCGPGCQSGPCYSSTGGSSGGSVSDIVSDSFFEGIIEQASGNCPGKGFYTRDAFMNAVGFYPGFGTGESADDAKREIAAFFAHVEHETDYMCYTEEINADNDFCDRRYPQYPCVTGQSYHGRGPLQLTWNYNYGAAGQSIEFDGLGAPETVATNAVISFKTALWYWMGNCHSIINTQGFGATISAINGDVECKGRNTGEMNDRVAKYQALCSQLGVNPGPYLTC